MCSCECEEGGGERVSVGGGECVSRCKRERGWVHVCVCRVVEDSKLTMSHPSHSLLTVLVDRVVNADGTELLRSYIEVSV